MYEYKRPEELAAPSLRAAADLAKADFIEFYGDDEDSTVPTEIGINKYIDEDGNVTWSVVFAESITDQATRYFDVAKDVKEIFLLNFTDKDIENIEDSWDEDWTEKK